jgi:hypothetical protein
MSSGDNVLRKILKNAGGTIRESQLRMPKREKGIKINNR